MKRLILLSLALLIGSTMNGLFAQSKQLQKARDKQAKEKIKFYEKGGWKIDGSTKTLKVALLEHYEKLNTDPNSREIVGSVTGCSSRNVCQNQALNNAMVKYAQEASSYVRGRVTSEVGNQAGNELDNFYSAYERLVGSKISGELKLSLLIYKESNDGKKEYDAIYIVNEENASKMRVKAMEDAMKESQVAQEHATKISEFVKEGFQAN